MPDDTVTVPRSEFAALQERVEDLEATLAMMQAWQSDDGARIPHDVVKAELAGDHAITAWRKYRGLTARQLAERAGISPAYLSEIVSEKKAGSVAVIRRIARVLGTSVDALTAD